MMTQVFRMARLSACALLIPVVISGCDRTMPSEIPDASLSVGMLSTLPQSEISVALANVYSGDPQRPSGTVHLDDERVYVEILDPLSYRPQRGGANPFASANSVRIGEDWATGVPAGSFELLDINNDGKTDIRLRWELQALEDAGLLPLGITSIDVWGYHASSNQMYRGTTEIEVIGGDPPPPAVRIVVNHDEWPLSDTGFTIADGAQFALNVASAFTGGQPGRFLIYSSNFGLTGPSLRNTLEGAGHTVVVSTSEPFTLENLLTYDAVWLGGSSSANTSVLTEYVNAGGRVYLLAGTGSFGSASAEAAFWNPFLQNFGLSFAEVYNNIGGVIPVVSSDPLLAGVSSLYMSAGNSIIDLTPGDPHSVIILTVAGEGLIAKYVD